MEVTAADDDLLLEIDTVAVRVAVDVRDGERDLDILFVAVLLRVVLTVAVVVCPGRLRDVVAVAVLVDEIERVLEIDRDVLRLKLDEDERLFAAVGAIEGVGDDDGVTEGGDDGDVLRLRLDEDERLFAAVGAIEGVVDDDGVTEGGDDGVAL